jgi:hypothetical protein
MLVFLYLRIQYLEKAKGPRLGAPVATELCYPQTYKLQMKSRGVQFKGELDRRLPNTLICTLLSTLRLGCTSFLKTTPPPPPTHLLSLSACYLPFGLLSLWQWRWSHRHLHWEFQISKSRVQFYLDCLSYSIYRKHFFVLWLHTIIIVIITSMIIKTVITIIITKILIIVIIIFINRMGYRIGNVLDTFLKPIRLCYPSLRFLTSSWILVISETASGLGHNCFISNTFQFIIHRPSWHSRYIYCHKKEWLQTGFGLHIGFIHHFSSQLVITIKYSAIANLHNLQFTRAHAKSFPACSVFARRFLVMACNSGD